MENEKIRKKFENIEDLTEFAEILVNKRKLKETYLTKNWIESLEFVK
jgi:hypothetical protein